MIDILMATYNGENFLSTQIESIICQTFKDWHLFIQDDCSTDNTLSIINEYVKKDSRITLIKNSVQEKIFYLYYNIQQLIMWRFVIKMIIGLKINLRF